MHGETYHAAMGLFAVAFVVGGLFLVRRAVAPLWSLRASLSSVREGRSQRIEGDHPSEVQPLVNELNGLLDDRERAVARALATAGDLAHGLKTPLAVLAQEAEQADAAGHHDLAATLRQLVERMQRQVDYHLARARATASARAAPGLRCSVLPSVEGLVRTMRRLHAERELDDRRRCFAGARDPGPPGRPRRDAGEPARQRVQVGALPSRHFVIHRRRPTRRSRWMTMGRASIHPCALRCCSEECGPTSRSGDPGSVSRSSAISPSSTVVPSRWRPRRSAGRAPGSSFHGSD